MSVLDIDGDASQGCEELAKRRFGLEVSNDEAATVEDNEAGASVCRCLPGLVDPGSNRTAVSNWDLDVFFYEGQGRGIRLGS